jgi:hypothetical protein
MALASDTAEVGGELHAVPTTVVRCQTRYESLVHQQQTTLSSSSAKRQQREKATERSLQRNHECCD